MFQRRKIHAIDVVLYRLDADNAVRSSRRHDGGAVVAPCHRDGAIRLTCPVEHGFGSKAGRIHRVSPIRHC